MKSFTSKRSGIACFIFFPLLFVARKSKKAAFIIICFVGITLSSCFFNFYKTNTKSSIDAGTVSTLSSENKYFVIHFANSVNGLENVYVKGDSVHGKLVHLPPEHSKYLYPDAKDTKNKVKAKDKADALTEVHLYTNAPLNASDSLFAASVTSFNRADIYQLNSSATTTNHILSVVGIITTGIIIAGFIAFLVECNCPQVYVENNGAYNFSSGLYSGAVYSTLERTDYLPLQTIPYNATEISFKIANAKNEEQFINKAELLQVDHAPDVHVLADRHGNILSYQNLQLPVSATKGRQEDIKAVLGQADEQYYSFDNNTNEDGFSDVVLSFNKPESSPNATLVIHARNSRWSGLIHKEFVSMFGDSYEQWRAKQEKASPKDLEKWQTEQALPLMVYVKINNEWKFVDYFQLVGNTASRDMAMQINTANLPGDKIELKLETTYRFWDLDFAGIDFTSDKNFTSKIIGPQEMVKSDNTDVKEALLKDDKQYVQLVDDESVFFRYKPTAAVGNLVSSYFLVSGGYYHTLEPVTGKTNYNELYKFRQKGAFDKFSREKYKQAEDAAAIMKNINGGGK